MNKILEGLGIVVVSAVGCIWYLAWAFIGAVITIVLIGGLFNLIF